MKAIEKLTWLALLSVLVYSCTDDAPPPPDVSHLRAPLTVVRYDRALMSLDTARLPEEVAALEARYPAFTDAYLRYILPLRRGDFSPEEQNLMLRAFVTYPLITELDSLVQVRFPDEALAAKREEFSQALRYLQYYLPDAAVPDTMLTFLAQFEVAAALYGEGDVAVGLEFFLGPDYDYQRVDPRETIFSNYLTRTYTPEHLVPKLMRVLIEEKVPAPRAGRLVDYLVQEGKKLYLLKKTLPTTPDSILHEVTAEQMDWLRANEVAIYAHLQKEKQFYSTDATLIRKLTQPAPSSQGMPAEAPGRAVNYLGLKIVEAYVEANPQTTMPELLRITDGQKMLTGARYKPR